MSERKHKNFKKRKMVALYKIEVRKHQKFKGARGVINSDLDILSIIFW